MVKETELIYLGKAKDKLWLGIMFLPFKSNYDIKVNTFYIIVIDDNIYKIESVLARSFLVANDRNITTSYD